MTSTFADPSSTSMDIFPFLVSLHAPILSYTWLSCELHLLLSRRRLCIHVGVCVSLCVWSVVLFLQRGYLLRWRSDGGVRARALGSICAPAWVLRKVCLSVPLIRCLPSLQSAPQNRPLIIVWCASGSAVTSYKKRPGLFIADSEREAWKLITEPRPGSRAFRAAGEATGAPSHPLCFALLLGLHGVCCLVWLG